MANEVPENQEVVEEKVEVNSNEQVNNEKETQEKVSEDKAAPEGSKEETITIPDELIGKAKELGISDFALSKFDNEAELQRYIDIRENEIIETGRRVYSNLNAPAEEQIPAGQQVQAEQVIPDMYEIKFEDPEMIDEGVRNALEGINKHYASALKNLSDKVAQFESFAPVINEVQNDRQAREWDKFDNLIAGLPTEYKPFVGEGGLQDILGNKDAKAIRDAIWNERESLRMGYKQTGIKMPDEKSLFKKAADIVLADKKEKIIKTEIKNKAVTRAKAVVGRPTNRESTSNLTPEEKAARNFDSKRNEFVSTEAENVL